MRKIAPEERIMKRKVYVKKIMNVIRTEGFQSLTIQDMANLMNLSRATLYNYFSSKDEIIMEVTDSYITYIHEADQTISNEAFSYQFRLQKVFEQTVLSAIYESDIFLNDLKLACPALYEKKRNSRKERLMTIRSFYQNGIQAEIFNEFNPAILIMQDEAALKKMIDSSFLIEEGLSLKQALYDYYELKKIQVLRPEAFISKDDNHIEDVVNYIVKKLTDNE